MSETKLNDESNDVVDSKSKSAVGKTGKSLQKKINEIKAQAKADIAKLKSEQVPFKKVIRNKIYEVNRRIKVLNNSLELSQAQIAEIKESPADSAIPPKYAVKIKKLDNQLSQACIKIYEDVLIEHQKSLESLDLQLEAKIGQINAKTDKLIDSERMLDAERKKAQEEKAKAKAKAALQAKRSAREQAKLEERELGLATLRQHLPISQGKVILNKSDLPESLKDWHEIILKNFSLVEDAELLEALMLSKEEHKYFSVIRQAMIDAIGGDISPADLLVVGMKQDDEVEQSYSFTLYNSKNRRVERLATQFGFAKTDHAANLSLPIDLASENAQAILNDVDMFFSDLAEKKYCTYIFDAENNALFKVK